MTGAGDHYRHDMRAMGTAFDTPAATDGPATARSFILVTPDGERTMNTYLGACQGLSTADVEADKVRTASITYLGRLPVGSAGCKGRFPQGRRDRPWRGQPCGADPVGFLLC